MSGWLAAPGGGLSCIISPGTAPAPEWCVSALPARASPLLGRSHPKAAKAPARPCQAKLASKRPNQLRRAEGVKRAAAPCRCWRPTAAGRRRPPLPAGRQSAARRAPPPAGRRRQAGSAQTGAPWPGKRPDKREAGVHQSAEGGTRTTAATRSIAERLGRAAKERRAGSTGGAGGLFGACRCWRVRP